MKELLTAAAALLTALLLWKKRKITGKGVVAVPVLVATGLLVCVVSGFSGKKIPVERVRMGEPGTGSERLELKVRIDGEEESSLELDIPERQRNREEAERALEVFCSSLDRIILGKNAALTEIRYPLELPESTEDPPIEVEWQTDRPRYLSADGRPGLTIPAEGAEVTLKGILRLQDCEAVYERKLRVYPSVDTELLEQRIREEAEELNPESGETDYVLPTELEGRKLQWFREGRSAGWPVLILAILLAAGLPLAEQLDKNREKEERSQRLEREYPELVSRIRMLLGAGLSMRKVFERIGSEYLASLEAAEKKQQSRVLKKIFRDRDRKSPVCEEILVSLRELENGLSETEVYDRFGKRCGTPAYRGLALLLVQNMTKGGQGLLPLLEQEAMEAFENRQRMARQSGEKISVRLLIPMSLLLLIVMALVLVPAFMSL